MGPPKPTSSTRTRSKNACHCYAKSRCALAPTAKKSSLVSSRRPALPMAISELKSARQLLRCWIVPWLLSLVLVRLPPVGRHRTHPAPPPVFAPRRLVANHPRGYGGLRPRLEASSLPPRATEVAQNKEHPMNNLSSLVTVICLALMSLVIALLRAEHQEERRDLIVAFIAREMGQ